MYPEICENNSTCINTFGDYECNCLPGYAGKNCIQGYLWWAYKWCLAYLKFVILLQILVKLTTVVVQQMLTVLWMNMMSPAVVVLVSLESFAIQVPNVFVHNVSVSKNIFLENQKFSDIDECESDNPCQDQEECINTEGSFSCIGIKMILYCKNICTVDTSA